MKQLLHTLFFLVLLILTSCHSGQEKYEGQGIVGAWQLTQEEWVDGSVQTEGLDRFKIFYEDGSFVSGRFDAQSDDDIFLAVDGGRFAFCDSVYQEYGDQKWANWLIGDSVIQIKCPDKIQVWKRYADLDQATLQMIKEETENCKYRDDTGHPILHIFSLAQLRAKARKKYVYAGVALLILVVMTAVGYALYSRRRRRHVERLLAQFEAKRQWDTEEDRKKREQNEMRFLQTDYYQQLQQKIEAGKQMSQHDWDKLEAHIALLAPDFQHKLTSLYPLSLQELRVSLLLKAHITPAGIATLTSKSASAVTSTRSRLYKKVFGEKGGAKEWDEFIASL